jgi:hypothetical protein
LFPLILESPGPNFDPAPDTLVICPAAFQPSLTPWIEYRTRQGHQIVVQPPAGTSYEIRQQVKRAARQGNLKNVVIVGDAEDGQSPRDQIVPTDYVRARVNLHFGSEPEISTDNTYADLDDDGVVDLAIGRIPIDTPGQLTRMIERIMAYESSEFNGDWLRRINFVAGVGGFGELVDVMIEQSVRRIITDLIPAGYDTSMTYGSWTSPYCPDPRRFSETAIRRFNEGCAFWVYIGHGNRQRLDWVMLPDGRFEILSEKSIHQIRSTEGSPIAIFLACYTGAIDSPRECLAEAMMNQAHGPVATICSTRVSMPYAMSVLSLEFLDGLFHGSADTLGQLLLDSKRSMVRQPENPSDYRQVIDNLGRTFSPRPGLLAAERLEHVQLMHLLGDPLLRIKRPETVELLVDRRAVAGQTITVSGKVPQPGQVSLDLVYRRDRFLYPRTRRREYDSSPMSLASYQTEYLSAHDLTCAKKIVRADDGSFQTEIEIPTSARGPCFLRVLQASDRSFALGATEIYIERQKPQPKTKIAE